MIKSESLQLWVRRLKRALITVVVWAAVLIVMFPLLWMVLSAFRSPDNFLSLRLGDSMPTGIDLSSFFLAFRRTDLPVWVGNSLIVASATTALAVVVATPYAYAMSRLEFGTKKLAGLALVAAYSVPSITLVVPLAVILSRLSLTNSLWGLVLVHMTFAIPFSTWVIRSNVKEIPGDLEEAAFVDGASRTQAFRHVIVPLLIPAIVAAGAYAFILSWNDFLFALVLIGDASQFTAPVGIRAYFTGTNATESTWAQLMAASVVVSVPTVLLFAFFQRYLVAGFLGGSVKG